MVRVRTTYGALLRQLAGRDGADVVLESPTLGELVRKLAASYGASFREALVDEGGGLRAGVAVLVNGANEGEDTVLQEGDEVAFLVSFAGGSGG